jgi:hypothetical protein
MGRESQTGGEREGLGELGMDISFNDPKSLDQDSSHPFRVVREARNIAEQLIATMDLKEIRP